MRSALFRTADRPLLNLGLLALTAMTTFFAFRHGGVGGINESTTRALMFSVSALAILGSHEMGHYLLARYHGVDTSLPYFIPIPFGFGTLGAVIRIRGRIPTRNALIDIGAAGPLAGIGVAIPVLLYGYAHSTVVTVPAGGAGFPGSYSLWSLSVAALHAISRRVHGLPWPDLLPGRMVEEFGDSLMMLGLRRIALGPLAANQDVLMHPCVMAGWFGMIVTMMNLIPIGQLDGGHVSFAVFGSRARRIGQLAAGALVLLIVFGSAFWLLWLVITTKLIGFRHPEVTTPEEPLSPARKWVAVLSLIAFVLAMIPIPISILTVP